MPIKDSHKIPSHRIDQWSGVPPRVLAIWIKLAYLGLCRVIFGVLGRHVDRLGLSYHPGCDHIAGNSGGVPLWPFGFTDRMGGVAHGNSGRWGGVVRHRLGQSLYLREGGDGRRRY